MKKLMMMIKRVPFYIKFGIIWYVVARLLEALSLPVSLTGILIIIYWVITNIFKRIKKKAEQN